MNTLFFIENQFKRAGGRSFLELDRDSNSRAAVIEMIRSGEVDPVKVLEIDEGAGTCRDVTEEFVTEAALRETAINSDSWYERSKARMQIARLDHARDLRKHGEAV